MDLGSTLGILCDVTEQINNNLCLQNHNDLYLWNFTFSNGDRGDNVFGV